MTIFAAIAGVTVRSLLGRRRSLLMLLLAGTPVLLGLLVRANHSQVANVGPTLDGFVVRVVLPLIALVFGTAALGAELDDGTAIHVLTKPINRWTIVVAKTLVAGTLTALLVVPSTVLGGLLLGSAEAPNLDVTFAFALANLIGSYLYVSIFLTLSVATSRGLIIGLAYALIWEGVVAGLLPGSQIFSVREYIGGIATAIAPLAVADSIVGASGFIYAAVALVLAVVLGSLRLSVYEIRGTD